MLVRVLLLHSAADRSNRLAALDLYRNLQRSSVHVPEDVAVALMLACARWGDAHSAWSLMSHIRKYVACVCVRVCVCVCVCVCAQPEG